MPQSEPTPRATVPAGRGGPRVGYVVKCYPRFSETFIVREVLAREAQGEDVLIASLRPPVDGRFHHLVSQVRAEVTWIDPDARSARRLWDALDAALGLPGLRSGLGELLDEDVEVAVQALRLAAWVRSNGVTHLHAHFATLPARTARLAALCAGVTYSLTAHAKDIFHTDVDSRRLDAVLRDAHHVVTVSDHNVGHLRHEHPAVAGHLHRVYNGLDLAELPFTDPADRPRTVVAVGRMVPKKGFDVLLEAVALMRARGDDVALELAGSGRSEDSLRERAAAPDLAPAVRFHGSVPQHELAGLLRRAAVFAAPCVVAEDGDRDGLPTVLLEAMALGTPCVSTPVTGIPEVVRDGATGLLVPERDAEALAGALTRLLDDGGLRSRLAVAGRALVTRQFDVTDQARRLRDLLPTSPVVAATHPGYGTTSARSAAQQTPAAAAPAAAGTGRAASRGRTVA